MTNPERILAELDAGLDGVVELTLYGRAALLLGFENAPPEYALSRDVDAVMWMGQAEELARSTNFWQVIAVVNQRFREQQLYISHFFEEDQVVLSPVWRDQRVLLTGAWTRLSLYRLGDADLFLSKLMRDDPVDTTDAKFIVQRAGFSKDTVRRVIDSARVPPIAEIEEQFRICAARFTG